MTDKPPSPMLLCCLTLIKVTKESCCYGNPVTKEKLKWQMDIQGNVMHFILSYRNTISHIDPELEDFAQLIDMLSTFRH